MPQSSCGRSKRESSSAFSNEKRLDREIELVWSTAFRRNLEQLDFRLKAVLQTSLRFWISHHADKRQVAIPFSEIQAVTDHELIGDAKTQIVNGHLFFTAFKFVQQRRQLHAG